MYNKSIILLILATAVLSAKYTSPPCNLDADTEQNGQCVPNTCFSDYIRRFKTQANSNTIPITFVRNVEFTSDGDLKVSLQFTDTVQNDGTMYKDNPNSCIEEELWRFKSLTYENGVQDTSTIVSTYDLTNSYRIWTFTIKEQDLETNLVMDTSESKYFAYTGYFGYRFKIANTVQVFYNFSFEVKVERSTKKTISIEYHALLQTDETKTCPEGDADTSKCITKADSSLQFCTAPGKCDEGLKETIELRLNQEFSLMQKITTPAFTNKYLILKAVYIKSNGLNRKIPPTSFNNTVPGQLEVQLHVKFVYSSVTIIIDSALARTPQGRMLTQSGRFLTESGTQTEGAHATIESSTINCIKTSESATSCPTCSEQQKYGAVDPICATQVIQEAVSEKDGGGNLISLALGLLVMAMMI